MNAEDHQADAVAATRAGLGATLTATDEGLVHRTWFGERTYAWDRLRRVHLAANGRRYTRDETPITHTRNRLGVYHRYREPRVIALIKLRGRLRRLVLTSDDLASFAAVVRIVVQKAMQGGATVRVAGYRDQWSRLLDMELP